MKTPFRSERDLLDRTENPIERKIAYGSDRRIRVFRPIRAEPYFFIKSTLPLLFDEEQRFEDLLTGTLQLSERTQLYTSVHSWSVCIWWVASFLSSFIFFCNISSSMGFCSTLHQLVVQPAFLFNFLLIFIDSIKKLAGGVPLPKVPKCQNSSDGTFGTFDTFGTVERHRRTEVASNGDQNLHAFFAYVTRPLPPSPHLLLQEFAD